VSGVAVQQAVVGRIQDSEEEGHELPGFDGFAHHPVGPGDRFAGPAGQAGLAPDDGMEVGHNEGGRQPLAGDVSHAEGPSALVQGERVQVVSPDGPVGVVGLSDVVAGDIG